MNAKRYIYFTDTSLYSKSIYALLDIASSLGIDIDDSHLIFISKNKRTLREVVNTPSSLIDIKRTSKARYYPAPKGSKVVILDDEMLKLLLDGVHHRKF